MPVCLVWHAMAYTCLQSYDIGGSAAVSMQTVGFAGVQGVPLDRTVGQVICNPEVHTLARGSRP